MRKITLTLVLVFISLLLPPTLLGQSPNQNKQLKNEVKETLAPAKIYTSVTFADSWIFDGYSYGIYSFLPEATTTSLTKEISLPDLRTAAAVFVDGKYYAFNKFEDFGYVYYKYEIYDSNKDWSLEKSVSINNTSNVAVDMAYDPVTKKTFGITLTTDNEEPKVLSTYNLETGQATAIATIPEMKALAINLSGELYAIGQTPILYKINKEDGSIASSINLNISGMPMSATFDYFTNKLYAGFISENKTSLYEIDPTNGNASLIFNFPGNEQIAGMYTLLPEAEFNAPAKVENLKFVLDNPEDLSGIVTFKAPAKTYIGEELTGELSVEIMIDGAQTLGNIEAGNIFSTSKHELTAGLHEISVIVSNSAGKSPKETIQVWLGPDYPAAVSDLTLSKDPEGFPLLSWEAPSNGMHNGYLDITTLKYKVIRNNDNKVVVNDLTKTTFTDKTLEGIWTGYTYTVIPSSSKGEGPESISNEEFFGKTYAIPYSETFDDETKFAEWSVIDENDAPTWQYKDGNAIYIADSNNDALDWLISPAIEIKEAGKYTLSFVMKAATEQNMFVTMGNSTDPGDHVIMVADYFEYKAEDYTVLTNDVDLSEGIYYIGFYNLSYAGASDLLIDKVELNYSNLPAVATIRASVAESDVILSWDEPDYSLTGLTLSGYNIYRNNVKINETVLQGTEYTDSKLANGKYSYTITAVYENAESQPSIPVNVEIITLGINGNENDADFKAYVDGKTLVLNSVNREIIRIVSIDGKLISEFEIKPNQNSYISLSNGVYVIKSKNTAQKVIIP